jgi:sigma-E factor negative regulatory protein RseA
MENMQAQELISALADGQLQGDAFAHGVEVAACDPVAREAWQTYHLIGDVLRSGELAGGSAPAIFMSRLQMRLQQEQGLAQAGRPVLSARSVPGARPESANDASFRWKLVAGVASLAAVAAIGWTMTGGSAVKPDQGQVAAVANERGVMIRDPRLDEFLAAHRQLGGASALQMPAGFLRNATFEGTSR